MSFPFWKTLEIRWRDQDAMGHVNNAMFPTYFEEARAYFFNEVGINISKPAHANQGPILAASENQYVRQLRWPATIRVGIRTLRLGNSSFHLQQVLFQEGEEQVICESKAVIVWFDYGEQKSTPIPDNIREKLESMH